MNGSWRVKEKWYSFLLAIMRTVCMIKKRLTLSLILSKYIFLFSNLKFCVVYAYILKKKQERICKNTTKIYALRHISSVTLSFSYDSVKPKKTKQTLSWKTKGTGNRKFSIFWPFRFFIIFYQVLKYTSKSNKMREPNPDLSLQTSLTPSLLKLFWKFIMICSDFQYM